jgi:IS30 family transposase
MNHYTRINLKEREVIAEMRFKEESIRSIAKILNRSPSSISRELSKVIQEILSLIIQYQMLKSFHRRMKVPEILVK